MSEMTDRTGPGPAEPISGPEQRQEAPAADSERAPSGRHPDCRQQRRRVPLTASWVVLLTGLVAIVVSLKLQLYQYFHRFIYVHGRLHRITEFVPGGAALSASNVTRTALVLIGLLLLMLSHGLRRRKRRSWQAVMALLIASAVIYPLHHRWYTFGFTVLLVAVGWYYRREFYAIGDPRTRWRALWTLVGLLFADLVIGLAYIAPHDLAGIYSYPQRAQSVLYGLVGATGPVQFGHDSSADFFQVLTGALGLFTVIVTVYLFLRPAEPVERLGATDAASIRSLLDKHGETDSLGYFALRDDKSVIWSPTGKACIGYRVLSGVMLASGDPIGDSEAWPGAIRAFLDEAARHAWVPAVCGCSELGAEVWCRDGNLTALELGDEAIVAVAEFSLQGRAMRNVRQMVTRVGRAGYVAEVRRVGDVPREELNRMIRQADSWRGSPTERGFSMALGRIGGPGDDRCVVVTAVQDGVLRALLHFVPWGADGLSLDLMRRDRSAQPGLNDFLIVEAIKAAQDLGVKRISLNFAAFRAALERGERIGAGPILRAWRRVLLFMSRWFQIESLYKFNAKFCPEWVPRFMVFPGTRDTVRIGLAALEAEAFLVWPTIELRRMGRKLRNLMLPRRKPPARQASTAEIGETSTAEIGQTSTAEIGQTSTAE
jgi:lysyl-tRNA synthetase class 2